ncbi:alpha/beta hydrolase [Microbacterium hatanonis]|uniref:Esterase family protein n=1 Tax=Microbacterium hatanonis TaxID=404366 RepID=A0A5C8I4V6_9MICO|nr:alpha/beta hydrolase family protein [Microbacterium hatanonis]TXK13094.1 esterase family protein [Microbacterium hatanonis]
MDQTTALTLVGAEELSPRLREITLQTKALATPVDFPLGANPSGETKVRVLLPANYGNHADRRYPVLYLLHGGTENYTAWTTPDAGGRTEELTEGDELIVVMPDGGFAGGYSDWYNAGSYGPPQWATYHLDQLIPWVDATFRTIDDRSGRAIAGLSMGGAALRYAAYRPDLFCATASFSGDIDILQPESEWRNDGKFVAGLIWGDPDQQELRWRRMNGPDLAANLVNTDIALYAGDTGAPESTFISAAAEAMHSRLLELGIEHHYTRYEGYGHDWQTFNRAFGEWLPLMRTALIEADPAPGTFVYETADKHFEIFGWRVDLDGAEGFTRLEKHSDKRLTLNGVGDATVSFPLQMGRDGLAAVTVIDSDGDERALKVTSPRDGLERSSVTVSLQDGAAEVVFG